MLGLGLSVGANPTCRLGGDLTAGLSDRLMQHCSQDDDGINGGASLGGSLFSSQATRTVSQFITRRDRSDIDARLRQRAQGFAPGSGLTDILFGMPEQPQQLGFSEGPRAANSTFGVNGRLDLTQDWPSGIVSLTNGTTSVFATFSYERRMGEATTHQSGYDIDARTAMVGAAYRVTPGWAVGANAYWGSSGGLLKGSGAIGADPDRTLPTTNNVLTYQSFDQLCAMPQNGNSRNRELGASVFSLTSFGSSFLNAEVSAARLKLRNARSLCLLNDLLFDDTGAKDIKDIWRGLIQSNVSGQRLDAKLRAGHDFNLGGVITGPQLGLDGAVTKLRAYTETETAVGQNTVLINDNNQFPEYLHDEIEFHNTTGAALAVNAQTITSLQSRVGLFAALPFAAGGLAITPFVEATWIHEFANNQREITARFAGDNRGTGASYFSFKTDAPDRNFFEVGGGLVIGQPGALSATLGGRTILGHSHFDSYTVEGNLRIAF